MYTGRPSLKIKIMCEEYFFDYRQLRKSRKRGALLAAPAFLGERDNQTIVLLLFLNIFLAIADDYATEGLAHTLASEVEG